MSRDAHHQRSFEDDFQVAEDILCDLEEKWGVEEVRNFLDYFVGLDGYKLVKED